MRPGALRPAVHAGLLGFCFLEPVLHPQGMSAIACAAFLFNLLVLPRTPLGRAFRREGESRWNGLVAYPLAVAIAYVAFEPGIAAMAWAVMALGDPAATLAGSARPWKVRIAWNPRKSAAGSLAFALAAFAGCAGCAGTMAPSANGEWGIVLVFSGLGALLGAFVESLPIPLDDNLPVLLTVGGGLSLLNGSMGGL